MERERPPWRQIVAETLDLLSSEAEQLEYERNVPHVDVTAELLCAWGDDSYFPGDVGFVASFSGDEMEALAKFNATFEANIAHLPRSSGTVRTWLSSEVWQRVMEAAKKARGQIAA